MSPSMPLDDGGAEVGASRPLADHATPASPGAPAGLRHSGGIADAVSREAVKALCDEAAEIHADYALYGDPKKAQQRESAEAMATALKHRIAQLPPAGDTLCAECGSPCRESLYGLPPACSWDCAGKVDRRKQDYRSPAAVGRHAALIADLRRDAGSLRAMGIHWTAAVMEKGASALEAASAIDARSGSTEGESAVPKGCAQ